MRIITAADARAAADHIEKVGLNQDGRFFRGVVVGGMSEFEPVPDDAPCCALGALMVVQDGKFEVRRQDLFAAWLGVPTWRIPVWSDTHTQDEVVAKFREYADFLDAEREAA